MTKNVAGAGEDDTANLTALRQDVLRLADTVRELVQHQTQAASPRVYGVVGDARGRIASAATDAQSRVCAAGHEIESRIMRHPLTAILIAACIGMSIGVLSRTRG